MVDAVREGHQPRGFLGRGARHGGLGHSHIQSVKEQPLVPAVHERVRGEVVGAEHRAVRIIRPLGRDVGRRRQRRPVVAEGDDVAAGVLGDLDEADRVQPQEQSLRRERAHRPDRGHPLGVLVADVPVEAPREVVPGELRDAVAPVADGVGRPGVGGQQRARWMWGRGLPLSPQEAGWPKLLPNPQS